MPKGARSLPLAYSHHHEIQITPTPNDKVLTQGAAYCVVLLPTTLLPFHQPSQWRKKNQAWFGTKSHFRRRIWVLWEQSDRRVRRRGGESSLTYFSPSLRESQDFTTTLYLHKGPNSPLGCFRSLSPQFWRQETRLFSLSLCFLNIRPILHILVPSRKVPSSKGPLSWHTWLTIWVLLAHSHDLRRTLISWLPSTLSD